MRLLLVSVLLHLVIATGIGLSWWVPDLTLVGLILAITTTPRQWLIVSAFAGFAMTVWATRYLVATFTVYIVVGWLLCQFERRWDASSINVQCVLALIASLIVTLNWLWLDGLWNLYIIAHALVRAVLTALCLPLVRWWLLRESFETTPSYFKTRVNTTEPQRLHRNTETVLRGFLCGSVGFCGSVVSCWVLK